MNPLRVLVLDDSAVCRAQLRSFLEADGDIRVVGEAPHGENVLALLRETKAQLLVVDLEMPRTNGHQTISTVMAHAPLPILVVTGQPLGPGRAAVFESVRRGALELAEKPSGLDRRAQGELRESVRRLAHVPVVRHVAGRRSARPPAPSWSGARVTSPSRGQSIVGIGASAGGPLPLATLLGALSGEFQAAVIVVQHLPASFFPAFAEFLQDRTRLRVISLSGEAVLRSGHVYVPSGDAHLVLSGPGIVTEERSAPRQGHRPSVDVLFESLAREAGPRAAGVVLSGMGDDGARGLLALRAAGGLCLAQDRASCGVWGMPKAAWELGATEHMRDPEGLAALLLDWAQKPANGGRAG